MTTFFLVHGAIVRIRVRIAARVVFALAMCGLISCQPPTATNGASSASSAAGSANFRSESHPTNGPVRDLSRDEAAGGHILRKHVGQTEEQLRERLERERNITGASTYTDRRTAEHVVGAAIAKSQDRIQTWVNRPRRHSHLVLDYDGDEAIGRSMNRGENQSRACTHAIAVRRYTGPNSYYVLTSYPECR